ncbi:hypothetical protein [Paenibacillus gallinarum]|uniref:Uncharacterized protein n=1 Tax=Paenibacillus gallinarum TaxID=2762232 RepID=A0ABR8T5R7_9BACL|nr:hypothetical protein [Paenibacillus gallinarum]MBD7971111.1 hypothetical protein [Paenibacillus gallinarum]
MRIFSLTVLFIILISSYAGVRVHAEEVTTTAPKSSVLPNPDETVIPLSILELKAAVPENFDKTILISMVAADQINIMGRLDKLNKYISSQEIKPGTYKVSFINIVGENANGYEIKRPEKITIEEGKTTHYVIRISLKANSKESEVPSNEAQEEMVADLMGANDKIGVVEEDQGASNEEISNISTLNVDPPSVDVASSTSSTKTIDDSTLNTIIGVSVLLVAGLLFFLYKQLIYKHDYYDC